MDKIIEGFRSFHPLSYSAFAIYGILVVYIAAIILSRQKKVEWMRLIPAMIFSFVGLAIGAKLFGIISYATYYYQDGGTGIVELYTRSGFVFYGGLLGYLLSLSFLLPRFFKGSDYSIPKDIAAATIPLFHGIARIGCFFGGCCYGLPYDGPLCIHVIIDGVETTHFPVMLIESAFNFLLFAALLVLLFKFERTRGKLTSIYLYSYSIFRFIIEFFRGDEVRGGFGPLSFSQYVSIIILVCLIVSEVKAIKRRKASA
ncbi:MAG: prolipoprotein diacylglyceryl transferase [Clostridia bacterium]|nr:prolipoprotein diacylglyceryl transferase [Clostridia bacterium]